MFPVPDIGSTAYQIDGYEHNKQYDGDYLAAPQPEPSTQTAADGARNESIHYRQDVYSKPICNR
jgi:hypothetical protein